MKTLFLMLLFSFSYLLHAEGDAVKGEILYKKCMACHGKDGMGNKAQKAPMLAGQFDWYLKSQIVAIKTEVRVNNNSKKMYPFVKNLSDQEIEDLAAYIAALPKKI